MANLYSKLNQTIHEVAFLAGSVNYSTFTDSRADRKFLIDVARDFCKLPRKKWADPETWDVSVRAYAKLRIAAEVKAQTLAQCGSEYAGIRTQLHRLSLKVAAI